MTRSEFEQRWRRRFTERGSLLDDDAGIAGWTSTGLATRVRQFRALWDQTTRSPGLWLDVGCGAGTYTRLLCDEGHRVIGMDYAVPSLFKAQDRTHAHGQKARWLSADVRQLPVADGAADGILCFGVMQALSDPRTALAELGRVLRPGGELWVDALNLRCAPTRLAEWRRQRRGQPAHLRYDDPDAFRAMVSGAGLRVHSQHWLPILPGRFQRWQWMLETPGTRGFLHRFQTAGAALSHSLLVRAFRPDS